MKNLMYDLLCLIGSVHILCILISHNLHRGIFLHVWENVRKIYLYVGLVFSTLQGEEKFPIAIYLNFMT